MYQSAQLMLNYIGRPEYGYNIYSPDITITSAANPKYNGQGFLSRVGAQKKE